MVGFLNNQLIILLVLHQLALLHQPELLQVLLRQLLELQQVLLHQLLELQVLLVLQLLVLVQVQVLLLFYRKQPKQWPTKMRSTESFS